jgi:hypothetical protein
MSATITDPKQTNTTDPQPATTDTAPDNSGNAGDKSYRTQEEFDAAIKSRLARESKKIREELLAELTAEADSKQLVEKEQWRELAEKRDAEKRDLKAQLDAREAQERARVLRYEVRDAARDAGFIDPDDAYHLIDTASIEFDDSGVPQGVAKLVKALAEKKPHLLTATRTRPNGDGPLPRSQDINLSRAEMIAQEIEAQRQRR